MLQELTSLETALIIVTATLLVALITRVRTRNYSNLMVIENKDRKFGAKPFYLAVRIDADEAIADMEDEYGVSDDDLNYFTEKPILFFTVNEIKVAVERARMNPEDLIDTKL
jgi:hypothetical protein